MWVLRLHALSVLCWLPLLALHEGAYIWRMPRLLLTDWQKHSTCRVPGRGFRYGGNLMALLAGAGAGLLFFTQTEAWTALEPNISSKIPSPLLAALFGAFLVGLSGLILFRPWRWHQ